MEVLLARKDICRAYGINRTTLYRWERQKGLPMKGGRITETALAWWIEQRDAARALRMDVLVFLKHPREAREKLLAAALEVRSHSEI